ncbi:MAG: IS21-like element helper ATPase IstB [Acidobacteriota bacterium]|nr:IS21-like element helper ATPase IstB [Acidobacteriota bacterium]
MSASRASLPIQLRELKLPAFVTYHEEVAQRAEQGGWPFQEYLVQLTRLELDERQQRKLERLRRASQLPAEKTLATLDLSRLSAKVRRVLPSLCEGGFVERAENLLAFGLPGRGKSHVLCAIGHELIQRGYKILFTPAYRLVQRLLVAKRDLALEAELRRLDAFDGVVVDDLGYIQQDREEMEVLFTFLAERYERKSVLITSNLVFSQWDQIFKNPMTTAAAIDRLVHHAIILEMTGPSIRSEEAAARGAEAKNT